MYYFFAEIVRIIEQCISNKVVYSFIKELKAHWGPSGSDYDQVLYCLVKKSKQGK